MEIASFKIDKKLLADYVKFRMLLSEQQRLQALNMPFDIGQSVGLDELVDELETRLLLLGAWRSLTVIELAKFRLKRDT